jgi:plastocyanin
MERDEGHEGYEGHEGGRSARARVRVVALSVVLVALTTAAGADPLIGRVEVRVRDGGKPAQVVVYAEAVEGQPPVHAASVSVTQRNKTFTPRVLGVPLGSTVTFPNDDEIFHNVFSLSSPQPFDLGLYRAGASKSRTFTQPAVYHVFCNIHPQMAAFLVVAPTPWVTTAGADGSFRLDMPPGRYRVTAMSERATPVSVEARVGADAAPVVIPLDESMFVPARHMNKFGKPYPMEAYKTGF